MLPWLRCPFHWSTHHRLFLSFSSFSPDVWFSFSFSRGAWCRVIYSDVLKYFLPTYPHKRGVKMHLKSLFSSFPDFFFPHFPLYFLIFFHRAHPLLSNIMQIANTYIYIPYVMLTNFLLLLLVETSVSHDVCLFPLLKPGIYILCIEMLTIPPPPLNSLSFYVQKL